MTIIGTANLLPKAVAAYKYSQNKQKILHFLSQEKFSIVNLIQELLGLQTRAAAWKVLDKMQSEKRVKRKRIVNPIYTAHE